jgi:hypothetical protein
LVNRKLIRAALAEALEKLQSDAEIEIVRRRELGLDSDTKGVAGLPPIVEKIFKKIETATAFVADLGFQLSDSLQVDASMPPYFDFHW